MVKLCCFTVCERGSVFGNNQNRSTIITFLHRTLALNYSRTSQLGNESVG